MPTVALQKEDSDYAVCFAAPSDAEGIFYIYGRQSCDTRKLEAGDIDVGNREFGGHEALVIFEDVFIPWENVFMCGEHELRRECWWNGSLDITGRATEGAR